MYFPTEIQRIVDKSSYQQTVWMVVKQIAAILLLINLLASHAYIPQVKRIKPSSMGAISALKATEMMPQKKVVKPSCEWSGDEAEVDYHHTVPVDCNYRGPQY